MGGDALFGYDGVFYTLFLLTPPRGGDKPGNTSSNALGFIFLLTPPRGGRQGYDHQRRANRAISTHAPAWGATQDLPHEGEADADFYSRPPRGGRPSISHRTSARTSNFYSRPRVGSDPSRWWASAHRTNFYSRPRMGATKHIRLRFIAILISTHAPAWGATIRRMVSWRPSGRFLLTPQNRGRTHRRGTPQAETGVRQP